jgi:hypothetical protein
MSQQFNQGAAMEGKMLLGLFNSMVHGKQIQQSTKALALDGWMVHQTLQFTAYTISIEFTLPSLRCGSLFVGSKSISQVFEQQCSFSLGDIKAGSFQYH